MELENICIGPLLLMVSGGSDSVALCRLVCDYCEEGQLDKNQVLVLHINHQIRGDESDGDELFVENLAQECGFTYERRTVNIPALIRRGGGNLEDVARTERYRLADKALKAFCRKNELSYDDAHICTAHTLDDRIETFVMRSIVGVGPGGLGSIPRINGQVIRPLMDLTRNHCRAYLLRKAGYSDEELPALINKGHDLGLWREDMTNYDTDHFRAYVRHEIIPRMRNCNPGLDDNLRRTMDLIVDESEFMDEYMMSVMEGGVIHHEDDGTIEVSVEQLFSLAVPVRRRMVHTLCASALPSDQRIESRHIERIVLEGDQERFAISLPGNILVRNEYGKLLFLQPGAVERSEETVAFQEFDYDLAFFGTVVLPSGETLVASHPEIEGNLLDYAKANATSKRVFVDGDRIMALGCHDHADVDTIDPAGRGENLFFSLHVTNIREGDTFCPLGLGGGHKKVNVILSDRKIPHRQRARTAIVRAGEEIVWVCGVRVDERFKITDKTTRIICLELNESEE